MSQKIIISLAHLSDADGFEIKESLDASQIDLEFDDLVYTAPLHVDGVVTKMSSVLTFKGTLASEVKKTCSRCLNQFDDKFIVSFNYSFDIKDKSEVDATEDIREALIFKHSQQSYCVADCKGLCSHCGVDLNQNSCTCNKNLETESSNLKELLEEKFNK